jgi:dihydrodipicolinate synthase/N-acetylneuraminate lyase
MEQAGRFRAGRDRALDDGATLGAADGLPPWRLRRTVTGMSAILLPFRPDGGVDWDGFAGHVQRTHAAGLAPAVNMDTGYAQLIDEATRSRALAIAAEVTGGAFVAGAFVGDRPGDRFDEPAYLRAMSEVRGAGGTPVVFPSHGLNALDGPDWVGAHERFAAEIDRFLAFELGPAFVPYGRIYPLDAYAALVQLDACVGAKHSSLRRQPEWDRLAVRDAVRPEFLVLTGNDLAIDMVRWGSDYLLGLSTFAPDAFARRDALWAAGDARVFELDDLLSYLGQLTFRTPTPGYRHAAAMFLALRGWIDHDGVWPGAPTRPDSDRALLADIATRLDLLLDETADVAPAHVATAPDRTVS